MLSPKKVKSTNKDCWKKVLGNRKPSTATGEELRKIEKCEILKYGLNYTGPLKEKRGYKQKGSITSRQNNAKEMTRKNKNNS